MLVVWFLSVPLMIPPMLVVLFLSVPLLIPPMLVVLLHWVRRHVENYKASISVHQEAINVNVLNFLENIMIKK